MKEKEFNTILKNTFHREKFGFKISDFAGGNGIQNPFDGFGLYNNAPLYWEAKLIKGGIYSFNFKIVEQHQKKNLTIFSESLKKTCAVSYSLVIVGFFQPREFFYCMFFHIDTINKEIRNKRISYKRKDLQEFMKKDKFLEIKYEKVIENGKEKRKMFVQDIDRLKDVII